MGDAFDAVVELVVALRRMGKSYEETRKLLEEAWEYALAAELSDFKQHREEERQVRTVSRLGGQ